MEEEWAENVRMIKMYSKLVESELMSALPITLTCIMDPFEKQKKEIDESLKDKNIRYELYLNKNELNFSIFLYKEDIHKRLYEYIRFIKENGGKVPPIESYAYYRMLGYTDEKACEIVGFKEEDK